MAHIYFGRMQAPAAINQISINLSDGEREREMEKENGERWCEVGEEQLGGRAEDVRLLDAKADHYFYYTWNSIPFHLIELITDH